MPFSAAGALIVLLVLGMVAHAAWSRHQRSLGVVDDISDSALLTTAAGIQGDLKAALRYAVYQALWEACERADDYDDVVRERTIEQLATAYFAEHMAKIGPTYTQHDARVELYVPDPSAWPSIDLEEIEGGHVLARAELPDGILIKLRSRDNSLSLRLPLKSIETFIDSRYFLLQERMGEFVERRGDICTWWGIMEYLAAWGGAWLNGKVELSDSRSRAFFETAWAIHEFNTFGSSDYWAAAEGLINAAGGAGGLLAELNNRTVVVTPVRAADVDSMCGYIDRALDAIEGATVRLEETKKYVGLARDAVAQLPENVENFGEVLGDIRGLLKNAIESVVDARAEISDVSEQFDQLLEFITKSAPDDVVTAALYRGLTSRTLDAGYPSLEEQVEWGVEGVLAKLSQLELAVTSTSAGLTTGGLGALLDGLLEQVTTSTEDLLSEPSPQRWATFTRYGGDPPRPIEERAPVYIDDEISGAIGALRLVLEGVKGNFNEMKNLSQRYEPTSAELDFEIDGGLASRLEEAPPEFTISREEFYELLSPQPIDSSPGLSVFHDFKVKNITYKREDPAGWLDSPAATPIPLWFIGVTLWWGQWVATLELEPGSVEEVLDYDNPTIPHAFGVNYVHKPLAYRWEMPEEQFSIRVIVVSLRPFSILDG